MKDALRHKIASLQARKAADTVPLAAITAYDYPTARLIDECGVDLVLVGDSLGMVVLGYPDTTHVTLAHMTHHIEAVARGVNGALVVGDLPINTYLTPPQAVATARQLCEAGAEAVKLEGGVTHRAQIEAILAEGIPVLGHLGMLPQNVLQEGGYKKKGKTASGKEALLADTACLNEVGCFAVVLESVVPEVAAEATRQSEIPTIGIGCGTGTCDGEIAVITDVVGAFPWFVPPFATPHADVAGELKRAVSLYRENITRAR